MITAYKPYKFSWAVTGVMFTWQLTSSRKLSIWIAFIRSHPYAITTITWTVMASLVNLRPRAGMCIPRYRSWQHPGKFCTFQLQMLTWFKKKDVPAQICWLWNRFVRCFGDACMDNVQSPCWIGFGTWSGVISVSHISWHRYFPKNRKWICWKSCVITHNQLKMVLLFLRVSSIKIMQLVLPSNTPVLTLEEIGMSQLNAQSVIGRWLARGVATDDLIIV